MSGKFITLEGGEGAGKSTQLKALAAALRARGIDLVETREPGGSPGAEAIRGLLLHDHHWTPEAEALLFAAARADHVARTIRPALERGAWVLCDRFVDSSIAYQGGAGGLGFEAIRGLHDVGSHGFLPDRTLLLQLSEAEAERRTRNRDQDGADLIGGRGADYHRAVNAAFARLAAEEPVRYRVIDAGGAAEEVTERLLAALGDLLLTPLYGHDEAVAAFRAGLDSGRLHHAWLLAGPKGIGKALFADKAALRILAGASGAAVETPGLDVPDDHPAARLIAAGSHPDHVRLERLAKESGTELARSINVDQVRGLQRLFTTTASMSPWRTVVIDAIDDLEAGGANALLKNLEEPPPSTVFLLVSHSPERLLPTIRSRCRLLRFSPLEADAMTSALLAALPDAGEDEIATLARVGEGAPGRAIAWRGLDVDALDSAMDALVREGDATNARRAALAQSLALKSAQPRYEAFLARAPSRIAAEAKKRRGPALAEALRLWERASDLAGGAQRLSLDPQSTAFELGGMLAALAPAVERNAA